MIGFKGMTEVKEKSAYRSAFIRLFQAVGTIAARKCLDNHIDNLIYEDSLKVKLG